MNNKGFTLIELLVTLVVLGLVISVVLVSVGGNFGEAKNKTEDIFVGTIEDAIDIYLNSDGKRLNFDTVCNNKINKNGESISVYKATTTFYSVINSEYKPLTESDLVNPANKDVKCNDSSLIEVNVYKDDDYGYYYSVDKSDFGCLKEEGVISNLPEGFDC